MTTDELHALDLGAAKVMGLEVHTRCGNHAYDLHVQDENTRYHLCFKCMDGGARRFQPTRSRADAMEVLEWVLGQVPEATVSCSRYGSDKRYGFVRRFKAYEDHETLPLAICKFALEVGRGRG